MPMTGSRFYCRLESLALASLSIALEMDMDWGCDDLLKALQEGNEQLRTPQRPHTGTITSDAAPLKTPPSDSTRASTQVSASSTPSSTPSPSPDQNKLPAPRTLFPGMFGKPGATESTS